MLRKRIKKYSSEGLPINTAKSIFPLPFSYPRHSPRNVYETKLIISSVAHELLLNTLLLVPFFKLINRFENNS
jgi:hypothetical protein